jgi:hypothetical protein
MKIDKLISEKDKLEVSAEIPNKREEKYIATLHPQKGHSCFEMNLVTKEIKLAEFEEVAADFINAAKGNFIKKSKVSIKPNCIYETALNKENAYKKFIKRLHQVYLQTQNK